MVYLNDENGNPIAMTTADSSGGYEFENVLAGDFQIIFECDGYARGVLDTTLKDKDIDDADFTMLELFSVSGTISLSSGVIKPDMLYVNLLDADNNSVELLKDFEDTSGNYEFKNVPWGKGYKIVVSHPAYSVGTITAFDVKNDVAGKNKTLTRKEYKVSGEVTVAAGTANWTSLELKLMQGTTTVATLDNFTTNGEFEFTNINGDWGFHLEATMTGYAANQTLTFDILDNIEDILIVMAQDDS